MLSHREASGSDVGGEADRDGVVVGVGNHDVSEAVLIDVARSNNARVVADHKIDGLKQKKA